MDELRSRTLLSALIGRKVKLQKAGREWKACCPFHNEKTPSFYVNDDKGFYHCFGCQAHGDAIRFLTDAQGLSFIDAVKELADAAGLQMPAQDPRSQEKAERAAGLYEVMAAAARWFRDQLSTNEGADARAYLIKRGLSEKTIAKFGLGYAPDSHGKLKEALREFGEPSLVEAGLVIAPGENRRTYDRFRGRLMIPIRDNRGRVIAFGGRILGSGEPKYLNSPDTPLFDKGRTLFNLDFAGPASREAKRLIVVEGYMDVFALDQVGLSETVAPLGTAITESQIQRLWQLTDKPLLCFDGDTAGQNAATRAAWRALPLAEFGRTLGFVTLPPGQDPDDLVQSGGTAALKMFLTKAEPLAQKVWRTELDKTEFKNPESRAGLLKRLLDLAESIQNPLVREEYKRTFKDTFYSTFGWKKGEIQGARAAIAESRPKGQTKGDFVLKRAVLLGLSRYPEVLRENLELAAALEFKHPKLKRWFDILVGAVMERPLLEEDLVEAILDSSDIAPVEKRDLSRDLGFSFFRRRHPERAKTDLREVIGTLVAERRVEEALEASHQRLMEATGDVEWEEQKRLLNAKNELTAKLSEFAENATNSEAA
ncbi:MAG TPA: DNA primase [Allosphingosinicella sp.]